MRLSQKVSYGLACLFELSKSPTEYVDADRIARKRSMPPAYAQKVLNALAHAGLVYSQKGSGYRIARPLNSITALDVISALSHEEPTAMVGAGQVLEKRIDQTLASVTLDALSTVA